MTVPPEPAPVSPVPPRDVQLPLDEATARLIAECRAARLAILGAEGRP